MSKVELISTPQNWNIVLNAARNTVGKEPLKKEPSSEWKRKILLAEHSPIRMLYFTWKWHGIKCWIGQHFSRHNQHMVHFITTSRDDRSGLDRDNELQSAPIDHEGFANAQSIIEISRKRLCTGQAHKETVKEWVKFLESIKEIEPELYSVCVPECIYRGFCPEMYPCNYHKSEKYQLKLRQYRNYERIK